MGKTMSKEIIPPCPQCECEDISSSSEKFHCGNEECRFQLEKDLWVKWYFDKETIRHYQNEVGNKDWLIGQCDTGDWRWFNHEEPEDGQAVIYNYYAVGTWRGTYIVEPPTEQWPYEEKLFGGNGGLTASGCWWMPDDGRDLKTIKQPPGYEELKKQWIEANKR